MLAPFSASGIEQRKAQILPKMPLSRRANKAGIQNLRVPVMSLKQPLASQILLRTVMEFSLCCQIRKLLLAPILA